MEPLIQVGKTQPSLDRLVVRRGGGVAVSCSPSRNSIRVERRGALGDGMRHFLDWEGSFGRIKLVKACRPLTGGN